MAALSPALSECLLDSFADLDRASAVLSEFVGGDRMVFSSDLYSTSVQNHTCGVLRLVEDAGFEMSRVCAIQL
jgi:hypothetical protein